MSSDTEQDGSQPSVDEGSAAAAELVALAQRAAEIEAERKRQAAEAAQLQAEVAAHLVESLLSPAFIEKRATGLFVLPSELQIAQDFCQFAERVFSQGMRFSGLDYGTFSRLAWDQEALDALRHEGLAVRFASAVVAFEPLRKTLYRNAKVTGGGNGADYLFERVGLEIPYQEPVYSEPDAQGESLIIGYVEKTRLQPARLDFDEFVADMWLKGVKFGIDEAQVHPVIQSGKTGRIKIASELEPTQGSDAELQEANEHLHRDNSPLIMASGKADLRIFKNRFPQMAKGERLLKKIPRVLGKQGRKVSGQVIEPKMPKDFDLGALASAGTRVEQLPEGEFIVSSIDGFLNLDPRSNKVSVTEKIVNKGGVSAKTTGDLALTVEEYVEHGEVQEWREVKGRNMRFMADVFGRVISEEGNINMAKNLSGGQAEAFNGDIKLAGRVTRSFVRSRNGEVRADVCESSVLVGRKVKLAHAVNCDILAEEVEIGKIEGCTVSAKRIKIKDADERRGKENQLNVVVPDLGGFDRFMSKLDKDIADTRAHIGDKTRQLEGVMGDSDFAKFHALSLRLKAGEVQLTAEQSMAWRKLVERHAVAYARSEKLQNELQALDTAIKKAEEELDFTRHDRTAACEGVSCDVKNVLGHSLGFTLSTPNGIDSLIMMKPDQMKETLHKPPQGKARIYSGDSGPFSWQFNPESTK